ncbi:LamG-like jellyroll fold domain-containing protein [Micromonospora sp. 067-2]|uniref:LamG-like jellyroll fold domain-containing protein n=1 Tax=Micromonospora sp. 067-2 TaxID=2789270 RepID=UPI0039785717
MRRSVTSGTRRAAFVVAVVFGLTVAVPSEAVRPGGEFPLSWLTWFAQRPAWSASAAFVGLPNQQKGQPVTAEPHVPASATDAGRGAGRAPMPAPGTLEAYRPHTIATTPEVTDTADPGFDARTSTRDARKSSARSDVFTNADGSFTKRTYNRPVNYRLADGSWQKIDSNLTRRADGRLHVTANRLGVSVAGAAPAQTGRAAPPATPGTPGIDADLAQLTLPSGESVGYRLQGGTIGAPEVTGTTARYRDVLPEIDLELTTFDAGVKETLVLRSPQAASSWVFPLRLTGLTPRLTATGSVELLDAGGKAVAWFPHGSMQDSKVDPRSGAPAESAAVTFEIITVDDAPALRVVADAAWLRDPARQYPVRVDPTATTGTTGDVYVDSDTETTNHNGDNLPVGTYDGGGVKARSFIHFDEFASDGFAGKRFSAAKLNLYHTWSLNCTAHKAIEVHRVTQAWTVDNLSTASHPGPTISAPIGSLTIGDNYPACTNTGGNRSTGRWVSVPLGIDTLNDWSTGGVNEGLALTASETDSAAWKRFTSANYSGGSYKPYLELTYTDNVPPQVNVRYPTNNAVAQTLTPELHSRAVDPDNWPNKGFTYNYVVSDAATGAVVANSGWVATASWTVPAGKLTWNKTYLYTVQVNDKAGSSAVYPAYAFTTSVPQPLLTANLAQNSGKGYDPSIGNYTTSATDASVATVGPSLSVTRSYNSLDTRRGNAFGAGWSSMLDTRATQVRDVAGQVQSVLITYPTGQDVALGRNANGTFTPSSGRFSVLTENKDSSGAVIGYTLTDKDASVYVFGQPAATGVFKVTSIADANGRAMTFGYDASSNATTVTSASGRSLTVAWSTPAGSAHPHPATVSTDPVVPGDQSTVTTWQYSYGANDQLTKVCPPTSTAACTSYQQDSTSQYANAVANAGPYSYWRLTEAAGATTAASSVLGNAGVDNARYTDVALGQPAALPGSTATTAGFNGTSSYVQLPGNLVSDGQYQSVSMWFKTTTPNGVLFSYQGEPITKGTTPGNYTPSIYIGSDGKLRGSFWNGFPSPINTDVTVTDGAWHHVVLAGAGVTQKLYLDGVDRGTLGGTIAQVPGGSANVLVGAGFVGGGWPGHVNTGASPAKATYFTGSIAEVAFFNQALTGTTVTALHGAGQTAHPVLTKVIRPSGGVTAQVGYDKTAGRVSTVTDENGGVWTMGTPTVSGSSDVYAASVLGAKPADYWRLGDIAATDAANEVQGGTATYSTATLGVAGPFSDSRAASFNGTTSHLQLPAEDAPTTGPNSVELWFKMPAGNTAGGVLYGYQVSPLSDPAVAGNWTPSLYVGTDGKLRGGFWTGGAAQVITSAGAVNDDKWHHVVLAAATNTQSLYLDGAAVGKLDSALILAPGPNVYVGAGKWAGGWPMHGTRDVGYFTGSIAEVAFYRSQLSADQVAAHFQASKQTAPVAVTMVDGVASAIAMPVSTVAVTGPTGERISYSYDLVNGNRMIAQTDGLGNTTKFGYDVGGFGNLTYDPRGVWTQELQDARGNTKQVITCQDQSASKCSSVYYTYYANSAQPLNWASASLPVMFEDFSGDGAPDVVYREADNTIQMVQGNGTGGWLTSLPTRIGTSLASANMTVAATDFSGDGKPDLLWRSAADGNLYMLAGNGAGGWIKDTSDKIGPNVSAADLMVYSKDFSGDGKPDIIFRSSVDKNLYLLKGNGSGGWLSTTATLIGPNVSAANLLVSPGDFDGDGKADVIYRSSVDNNLYLLRGNGSGGWVSGTATRIGIGWGIAKNLLSAGDFDGDKKPDVVYQRTTDNDMYLVSGNGAGGWMTGSSIKIGGVPDPRNDVILTMRDGRSSSATDNRYLTSYGYDGKGNQATITDPLGRVTRTAFTDGTTVAAKNGGFAPAGLPARVTTAGGQTQTITYYASGDVAEMLEPGGKVTRYAYDGLGRLLTETEVTDSHPEGLTTSHEYDRLSREITETEPGVTNRVTGAIHTARTTTVHDDDGNVSAVTVSDLTGGDASRTERHTYNSYGQESSTTNGVNQTTAFEYDRYGRVVKETEPDAGVTTSTYDVEGNLLTTTVKSYTGDPNNPSAARDLVTTTRAYDPAGRLASETDAMRWTTSYTYTDNGLEAKVSRTDGSRTFVVEENVYDAAGNVVSEVTNNGYTVTTTEYDAAGRTTASVVDPNGLKRRTALTYDTDDNVVSTVSSGPDGTVTSVSEALYDSAGRAVAETEYPSAGLTPVGRWKLDETTGTKAADSAGNSPATTSGNVTWSTERGGAAVFDGTKAYLQAGPVLDAKRAFTISAWAKLASENPALGNAEQLVFEAAGAIGDSAAKVFYSPGSDRWYAGVAVRKADGGNTFLHGGGPVGSAVAGTWTHLVLTADPATKTMKLYADGALLTSQTTTEAFNNTATGFSIGGSSGYGWFPGSVSDVQVYQKALSDAEISQVKAGTAPAADAHVIRTSQALDSDDLPTSVTDPRGNTTYYGYDEEGRAVKTTAPAAMVEQPGQVPVLANAVSWVGYNTFDEPTDTRDANGNWAVVEYDAVGRVVSEKAPAYTPPGAATPIVPETRQSYDETGQLKTVTDPRGKISRYEYDQLGRVSKQIAPNDGATTYTYDDTGNVLSTTDPTGAVSTATYDYLGRTLTSTEVVRQEGKSHTTRYTYNDQGWPSQVSTAAGVNSATTYNAVGDPLTVTDGANNVSRYEYDAEGRTTKTIRPDGSYATVTYDMADRAGRTAEYSPTGTLLSEQSARYDRAGNLVASTDARGTTVTYDYDATGVVTRESQPISGSDAIVTTFGYDLEGNRTRFTDGRGNAFHTSYNSWGLPESMIEPATAAHPNPADRTFTLEYDRAGQPLKQTMPGGVTVTNAYDDLGQLVRQSGTGAEVATQDRTFGYDVAGRMTSLSGSGGTNTIDYDDRGLPRTVAGPSGNSTFGYDPDGRLASRQDAAGTTGYTYDGAGRLSSLANSSAGVQMAYTYNTLSQVSKITYGSNGNTRDFTFDPLRRLTGDELKSSAGASLAKITYGWDANSNITSKSTTGFAGSATNTYSYDLADRLTSWNNGASTTAYAYDKSGNRVQNGSKLFTYDQRSRLLTADGASYTYTARGTLAAAGGNVTRTDAFGQVVSQQSAGGTQTYTYDGLGRAVRPGHSYTGLGNDLAGDASATYVRGPSGEVVGTTGGGSQRMVWTDLHSDVVGQFSPTGTALAGSVTYDPLGKALNTSGLLGQLGYQSEWTDALTSRVNMHARWYNTDTGQFDTRDTASNSPLPDSINANRYQYGDANPLTVTDPSGHFGLGSLKKSFNRAVSSVSSSVRSYASSAYSYASSYASSAYSYASSAYSAAKTTVKKTASRAKAAVQKKYHQAKKKYNQVKKQVKKKYNQVKRAVKKKVDQARKAVAKKAAAVKKRAKQAAAKLKQAGKKVAAKAQRVVKKATTAVRDAANSTTKWVKDHKDVLIEIAAVGGAILAGLACTAVTAGAGAIACMAGTAALINLAKDAAQGDIHSIGDALGSLGTGAVTGLIGGAGGAVAARVGAVVAKKVGTGLVGRLATEAAENGVEDAVGQLATSGTYNPRAAAENMVPGLGALSRKGGGGARSGGAVGLPSSARSFSTPSTRGQPGGVPPFVKTYPAPSGDWSVGSRLKDAERHLGEEMRENATRGNPTQKKNKTWTSGVNVKTGQVAVACSGNGYCAEGNVVNALGGNSDDIDFTKARQRTSNPGETYADKEKPICTKCYPGDYRRDQFPSDATFDADN